MEYVDLLRQTAKSALHAIVQMVIRESVVMNSQSNNVEVTGTQVVFLITTLWSMATWDHFKFFVILIVILQWLGPLFNRTNSKIEKNSAGSRFLETLHKTNTSHLGPVIVFLNQQWNPFKTTPRSGVSHADTKLMAWFTQILYALWTRS